MGIILLCAILLSWGWGEGGNKSSFVGQVFQNSVPTIKCFLLKLLRHNTVIILSEQPI